MFRSKLTLTLIALLSVLFFTRLGFWQLERAQRKQALRATVQSHTELPPLVLHDLLSNHEELRFRKVLARGTFDPEQQILLDNRTYQGRTGYHVVTPLRQDPSDPGGLVRVWSQLKIRHEPHIGYAIQWFAFAAMVLVIYLRTTLRYAEPERR